METIKELTKDDKFYFFSRSKDVPPGEGTNEYVKDAKLYNRLGQIRNFRRILSNFHVYPFKFEGYTYNSIEHVFQAKKIELADRESAFNFTLESGHEIGRGDGNVAQKNRKLVVLNKKLLEKWDKIGKDVMRNAAIEKYKACEEARIVLKATLGSQLWHIVSRRKPVRFVHLEEIRDGYLNTHIENFEETKNNKKRSKKRE